jgi:hypothetical protein
MPGPCRPTPRARALGPDLSRLDEPKQTARYAVQELGRRTDDLTAQIKGCDKHLNRLVDAVVSAALSTTVSLSGLRHEPGQRLTTGE